MDAARTVPRDGRRRLANEHRRAKIGLMRQAATTCRTLDEWIAREAIPFSLDSSDALNAAVDRVVNSLGGDGVELLALGEPLHGGEDFLVLRNRLFQRLVEAHGYTAIAVESSFPRAQRVDDYVAGRGAYRSYEDVRETGFSHGFGRLDSNRDLIESIRRFNAGASHAVQLAFYGFDSPTEMMGTDSPRKLLHHALDYLDAIDGTAAGEERRHRIDALLGADADWENPAAMMDPSKSIGRSPAANALRVETEELVTGLQRRRPELAGNTGAARHAEALRHATLARQMLTYHAGVARPSDNRIAELLGVRDLMMADNLAYAVARERLRGGGRVFAHAHNSHLKRGQAQWQLGPHDLRWWPAGAQLAETLGPRYAVIGAGVGVSEENGIAPPEPGTLEARLTAAPGPARFIPTRSGQALPPSALADLPTRSASAKNPSYFPLMPRSFTDFDALVVLDSTTYTRGGPPLQQPPES
jgi:erythromycin esterase-like protein